MRKISIYIFETISLTNYKINNHSNFFKKHLVQPFDNFEDIKMHKIIL